MYGQPYVVAYLQGEDIPQKHRTSFQCKEEKTDDISK